MGGEVPMLALLPTACSLLALAAPPVITPAEAAQHVGKEVIVQGKVEQIVTTINLTTHVNFGGRYPDQLFTGKIFKAQQGLFAGVKAFEGKLAQVQGVVRVYRGKPEIGLDEPSQLRLVEPATTPASPPLGPGQPGEPPALDHRRAELRCPGRGLRRLGRALQERGRTRLGPSRRGHRRAVPRRDRVRGGEGRKGVGGAGARVVGHARDRPVRGERRADRSPPAPARRLPGTERDDAGGPRPLDSRLRLAGGLHHPLAGVGDEAARVDDGLAGLRERDGRERLARRLVHDTGPPRSPARRPRSPRSRVR